MTYMAAARAAWIVSCINRQTTQVWGMTDFDNKDLWKGIILFGLNAATYKLALAKSLLEFSRDERTTISWDDLSESFLSQYQARLRDDPRPQQGNPARLTVMERVVMGLNSGTITQSEAIDRVSTSGLQDVVPRFHTIGTDKNIVKEHFYEFEFGKRLILTDCVLELADQSEELEEELLARWSLLEGAFTINQCDFELANDVRETYLASGYERTPLAGNVPFLSGYQGNTCFYCGEALGNGSHVDHVLPRQVLNHDEIWNLALAHKDCNLLKSDKVVGPHFIRKLVARNENIMGSNHPWKHKISGDLGSTPKRRRDAVQRHYNNVKTVLGEYYWGGGPSYDPSTDPFYRRLITVLNNGVVHEST